MTTATKTPTLRTHPKVLPRTRPQYHPGDLVVVRGAQPLVCVVLEELARGYLRLSRAAWPEARLLVRLSDVQHLSTWLQAGIAAGRQPHPGRF